MERLRILTFFRSVIFLSVLFPFSVFLLDGGWKNFQNPSRILTERRILTVTPHLSYFLISLSHTHTTSNLKWTKSGPSFNCLRLLGSQLLPHVLCRKEAINQNRDILKRCLRYIRGKFVVKFWLNYTKFKKSNKFYRYIVRSYIPEPYHGLGWQIYTLYEIFYPSLVPLCCSM